MMGFGLPPSAEDQHATHNPDPQSYVYTAFGNLLDVSNAEAFTFSLRLRSPFGATL